MVKRINHSEATNTQLREEAEKLRSERTAYRMQIDDETQNVVAEKEAQLLRAETDLARIRNARDELLADQQMRKAAQEQEKTATIKIQELASAGEARIASLESEVERLRVQVDSAQSTDVAGIPVEELRTKYQTLERQYAMLNTELASMQMACKKYSTLASQKVADFSALEEKVARLVAEKSKADQKFFAAMKAKEAREMEVRTLRMQNSKSSDIISQLKDSEAATRSLVANMEKQASESKEALNTVTSKLYAAQQQLTENGIITDGLKNQIAELKALSTSKDSTLANTSSACRRAETEIEGLKVSLADTKKSLDNWKNKSLGNSSSEYEMLRVGFRLLLALGFDILADLFRRHLRSAQYAAGTSRTRQLKRAAMSSAKNASKNVLPLDHASVRIAISPLGIMTTCTSPSDYSDPEVIILFASFRSLCLFDLEDFNFLYHSFFFGLLFFFFSSFPNICCHCLLTPRHFYIMVFCLNFCSLLFIMGR